MKSRFLSTSILFFFMATFSGPTLAWQQKVKAGVILITLAPLVAHLLSLVRQNPIESDPAKGSVAWLIRAMKNSAKQPVEVK